MLQFLEVRVSAGARGQEIPDFLAENTDMLRGSDANADPRALYLKNLDGNAAADVYLFTGLPTEHQHGIPSPSMNT
jgi:hypothetical protein